VTREERDPARTLEALARTGERLKDLIEAVPAVIYEAEPGLDAPWHYVSPQLEWLVGDAPEDWIADPTRYTRRLHPDDREAVFRAEDREFEIARGEAVTCVSEYRMLHADGRVIWVRDEARLMDADSSAPFWRGVLVNITEQRAARHALAETYKRFQVHRTDAPGKPTEPASDVLRITCSECGAVGAAYRSGPCEQCGSPIVTVQSMDALASQLADARQEVEDLLDGIQRHLEMLGTSLHGGEQSPARRVVTLLPDDDRLAG
jgi:PAS domain S-box-containing protein